MGRLMRLAFESEATAAKPADGQGGEATIVMKGPLSAVFHQALAVAYAKTDTVTGEPTTQQQDNIATESQANDALMLAHLGRLQAADAEDDSQPENGAIYTIYGVSKPEVDEQVVVDLTREVVGKRTPCDFYLVIDGSQPGVNGDASSNPSEELVALESAMRTVVRAHGGLVFENFKDVAQHIRTVCTERLSADSAHELRAKIRGDNVVDPSGETGEDRDTFIDLHGAVGNAVRRGVEKLQSIRADHPTEYHDN